MEVVPIVKAIVEVKFVPKAHEVSKVVAKTVVPEKKTTTLEVATPKAPVAAPIADAPTT